MADNVKKLQLTRTVNKVEENIYPYTSDDIVYHEGSMTVHDKFKAVDNRVEAVNNRISSIIANGGTIGGGDGDPSSSGATSVEVVDARIDGTGQQYNTLKDRIDSGFANVDIKLADKIDGAYVEDGYLFLTSNGEVVGERLGPFLGNGGGGGGGSSSGNNASLKVSNASGFTSKTVASGKACPVKIEWSSIEDEMETGSGTITITIDGLKKGQVGVPQGLVTVDLSKYLKTGTNGVKLKVEDVYGNSRTISFTINLITIGLTSSFDASAWLTEDNKVYTCIPTGAVSKVMHFVLDNGTPDILVCSTSAREFSYTLPTMEHGTHTFDVYFTCEIDGEVIQSDVLHYELLRVSNEGAAAISTDFKLTEVDQYASFTINYLVYDPKTMDASIKLLVNDKVVSELTVPRSNQIWSYRADTPGDLKLSIICGETRRDIFLTVIPSVVTVEAAKTGLSLYLSSYGRSNYESNPGSWKFSKYDSSNNKLYDVDTIFRNFNYSSDGWLLDKDNVTALHLQGDARVEIPYHIFDINAPEAGKTIEFEFATSSVMDYDSVLISCMGGRTGNLGIEVKVQEILLNSSITRISTQYKENEHVRISFVIDKEKIMNEKGESVTGAKLLYCYINGILSAVKQYANNEDFTQGSYPSNIVIGSNGCAIDLYCIRVYDTALSRYEIVENWIADTQDGSLMVERFMENNIYNSDNEISIAQLPSKLPYMIIEGAIQPRWKGDKQPVSVTYVNNDDPTKSFTAVGASANVQGTSSQYYARKNYKISFKKGFDLTATGTHVDAYQMRENSIPTNTFTFKADVASSEGANNVELVRYYEDICPYKTPPQKADSRFRQGIDGFPIVVFWKYPESDPFFIGKYNFNNDKGTPEVYGFEEYYDEETEELIDRDLSYETKDNYLNLTQFKKIPPLEDQEAWEAGYEGRFPDGFAEFDELSKVLTWINSTDQTQAPNTPLEEPVTYEGVTYENDTATYRAAKFRNELGDWFVLDSIIFYYLYTEIFLMVDSRVKNSFPTKWVKDNGKWSFLPYDMDTAIGINNEGDLVFSYSLEDIDHTESGAEIFNGQETVLWVNLRNEPKFYAMIEKMYQDLRSSGGLSYEAIEKRFEEHQSYWSASIFNQDAYYKYLEPLNILIATGSSTIVTNPDDTEKYDKSEADYLPMCQGSKEEQRKYWLYNRFKYLDSKYNAGSSLNTYINFRAYAWGDFTITPYADIYIRVKSGSMATAGVRAERNKPYTISVIRDTANDTETMIYSADQLKDVGDLSPFKIGYCNIAAATKLQYLRLGAPDNDHNLNLKNLSFGNNTLLKFVDVRNCDNLEGDIDLTNCINIEEAYFDNTGVKSVTFMNGGSLRKLHLPKSLTSLRLRNQRLIEELVVESYENITTLELENINNDVVPFMDILNQIKDNDARVRIVGFDLSMANYAEIKEFTNMLDMMRGINENGAGTEHAQMNGIIRVPKITSYERAEIHKFYPDIKIVYEELSSVIKFVSWDGVEEYFSQDIINTESVLYPDNGPIPERPEDNQYEYEFSGYWTDVPGGTVINPNITFNLEDNKIFYPIFNTKLKSYTVTFYNGLYTELYSVGNVPYGSTTKYNGPIPEYNGPEPEDYGEFIGWEPDVTKYGITGNTIAYAKFRYIASSTIQFVGRRLKLYEDNQITNISDFAFFSCNDITSINCPNVVSIGAQSIYSCANLETLNIPQLARITGGNYTFGGNPKVKSYRFPVLTGTLPAYAFSGCTNLESVDIGLISSIGAKAFNNCTKLKSIIIRSDAILTSSERVPTLADATLPASVEAIYVKGSMINYYKKATNWVMYADKFVALETLG